MDKIRYGKFKDKYFDRFVKYYADSVNEQQRKELKRSIFDNPNLTIDEKEDFWDIVVKGGKDARKTISKSRRLYHSKSKRK